MPRNKSELAPGLIELTTSPRLNRHITHWNAWMTSKGDPREKDRLYAKVLTSSALLTAKDSAAWGEIEREGKLSGERLMRLCHAAQ